MEEEEDDFYDPTDSVPAGQSQSNAQNGAPNPPQDTDDMDEEEVEVEDDEVRFPPFVALSQSLTGFRMILILSQRHLPVRHLPSRKQ